MADDFVLLPDSPGTKLDTESLTVGANAVERQRIQIAGSAAADIAPVSATTGLSVDVKAVAAIVPGTGASNLAKAEDAPHNSGDVGVMMLGVRKDTAAAIGTTDGDYVPPQMTATGALRVCIAEDAVANSGQSTMANSVPVAIASNQSAFPVNVAPATSGGLSVFKSLDLDETEEEVKGTAGQVYGWDYTNLSAGTRYLKFYDATAANVTVGTTVPKFTIPVFTLQKANVLGANGITFSTAITVAVTTGLADNDAGAPGTNDFVLNLFYA